MGLEGPLGWLAEQLEARDRAEMNWLWELAPGDLPRLERCVAAYERRYPRSNRSYEFRGRLKKLARDGAWRLVDALGGRRRCWRLGALAGSDLLAFHRASSFERAGDSAAPAVARRWSELLEWHPSLPSFWPALARQARLKKAEWQVKAADVQVANGTAPADLHCPAGTAQGPGAATGPRDPEGRSRPGTGPARRALEGRPGRGPLAGRHRRPRDPAGDDRRLPPRVSRHAPPRRGPRPGPVAQERAGHPAVRRRAAVRRRPDPLRVAAQRLARPTRSSGPASSSPTIPTARSRPEVQRRLESYLQRLDEHDIEQARDYSRQYPTQFATRIERYQDYLKAHQTGGRFISEAIEAKDRILREWDAYAYRQAYDHAVAHPDDVAEVARRLRDYLRDHPDGRYAADAQHYLDWWDKVSVPGQYRVTLRRGEVEPTVGKYLAGGAPDLGVVIEVAGTVYGPSSVIRDSHRPIWDYTFPQPITWKLGDPITIRIIDYDWSASEVYVLHSRQGDPLAMRLLSGTIKPAKGGKTSLVFASDFTIPTLSQPE